MNTEQRDTWRIRNIKTNEFWSNEFGWVEEGFDTFSQSERNMFSVPIQGVWESYSQQRDKGSRWLWHPGAVGDPNPPRDTSHLSQSATDTADPKQWPSIQEQLDYWQTHDHGGNVLPSRIEANEEQYGD